MRVRCLRSGSLNRRTHHTRAGTSHCAVMCGCPLACDIIPGPNPASRPPTAAANRCVPTVRASSRYQAAAVAARFRPMARAKLTGAPNASVTGPSSRPSRITEALASRFTPSGALRRSVTRLKSPA
ncbi:hypothetical protein GCM10009558_072860 [Virgisporangium aurantiacum]